MEKLIPYIEKINKECKDGGISKNPWDLYSLKVIKDEYIIYKKWEAYGYSGGSCWGDEATYYEGKSEPEFKALDMILEVICPNISYLQYKKLSNIITYSDRTENEYYGNSTTYKYEYIYLSELLKWIRSSKIDNILNEVD